MSVNVAQAPNVSLEETVLEALHRVTLGPDGPDVIAAGHIYDVVATAGAVRILVDPERASLEEQEMLSETIGPLVEALPGVARVVVKPRPRALSPRAALPGVRHVIGVHSGKGGVGKSTIAANLSVALAMRGFRVGLLDADVYGPSCPTLLGLRGRAREDDTQAARIAPMQRHGVKVMSLGFLMPEGQALLWRGALVDEGLPALFTDVNWGELDVLLVDLPPGTSDVHLAVAQHVPLSGIVTVSAPGQVSVDDVRRGMEMFADLAVPCLGLIENMDGVRCQRCGQSRPVFGAGGVQDLANETGVPLLARIAFDLTIGVTSDAGKPLVLSRPESAAARAVTDLAATLSRSLHLEPAAKVHP
jgi:ATP-binding protein involved in chromosome partitioning